MLSFLLAIQVIVHGNGVVSQDVYAVQWSDIRPAVDPWPGHLCKTTGGGTSTVLFPFANRDPLNPPLTHFAKAVFEEKWTEDSAVVGREATRKEYSLVREISNLDARGAIDWSFTRTSERISGYVESNEVYVLDVYRDRDFIETPVHVYFVTDEKYRTSLDIRYHPPAAEWLYGCSAEVIPASKYDYGYMPVEFRLVAHVPRASFPREMEFSYWELPWRDADGNLTLRGSNAVFRTYIGGQDETGTVYAHFRRLTHVPICDDSDGNKIICDTEGKVKADFHR